MKKNRIKVFGKVQGVAFRYYTRLKAIELGILGTVENQSDGSVEIFALADENSMDLFVDWCRKGSPASKVSHLDMEEQDLSSNPEYEDFLILR